MQKTLFILLICLSACAQRLDDAPQDSISGVITLDFNDENQPGDMVHRSPNLDDHITAAEAHEQLARRHYNEAFGGFLAACDLDHPDNCFRAADIMERKLLVDGSLSVFSPEGAETLFEVACRGGMVRGCARASAIELP